MTSVLIDNIGLRLFRRIVDVVTDHLALSNGKRDKSIVVQTIESAIEDAGAYVVAVGDGEWYSGVIARDRSVGKYHLILIPLIEDMLCYKCTMLYVYYPFVMPIPKVIDLTGNGGGVFSAARKKSLYSFVEAEWKRVRNIDKVDLFSTLLALLFVASTVIEYNDSSLLPLLKFYVKGIRNTCNIMDTIPEWAKGLCSCGLEDVRLMECVEREYDRIFNGLCDSKNPILCAKELSKVN